MAKCVVSGCPNRAVSDNRGIRRIFNRPPKRFFKFPKDPARVKVWLAALREPDRQDSAEQRLICEDHFLPEDISNDEVNSDAIPIMPPCLDTMGPWGAESSEEEEEEDQWDAGGVEDEGGDGGPAITVQSPRLEPLTPKPSLMVNMQIFSGGLCPDVSVTEITKRLLELMLASPDSTVDVRQLTAALHSGNRRICDITNVLQGIQLLEKQSAHKFKWIGSCCISSFLWKNQQEFQADLDNLQLMEATLDGLIRSCSQQLFDITDNMENAAYPFTSLLNQTAVNVNVFNSRCTLAYVTHEDVSRLSDFQQQTVIVVKAPEETKLVVSPPTQNSIQVHLKGNSPIVVLTSDIGTGGTSGCFVTPDESRIRTATLHTGNNAATDNKIRPVTELSRSRPSASCLYAPG
uniref:THAP-type domain-containing protein n=1 Tax=Mola mola TaxID=94237 RepID=A0A3Q3WZ59_MOLML